MKRHTVLKANPDTTRAWQRRTRKALPERSTRRKDEAPARTAVREAVFERDGWRCRMSSGLRPSIHTAGVTFHHLAKEGQGGEYTAENGIALCSACNVWVEDNPRHAHRLGLVQRQGDTLAEVWQRLYEHGITSSPEIGSAP